MRSRTANWFETTVRYERQTEDAGQKVNEIYVVDALTFGEAEETITKEMEPFVTGEFEVKNISPASYGEIFFSDSDTDDRWYKAKLSFITLDEKTAKEKRSTVNFLVQAATFNAAVYLKRRLWMYSSTTLLLRRRRRTISQSLKAKIS